MLVCARTHHLGRHAGQGFQLQHHDLEKHEQRAFVGRPHRQYRCDLVSLVAGHGLRRDVQRERREPGGTALRLCRHKQVPGAAFLRHLHQRQHGRCFAGPRGDQEDVAFAERRHRHVADHRHGQAQMEQPHRETLDLQSFASAAIDADLAGAGKYRAGRVDCVFVDASERVAQLIERRAEQVGPLLRTHDSSAIRCLV